MLKIAKKKQNVHLIAADVENLPFRQNVFDAAVCSRALYLFDNKFKVLQEAYAVLKRGGKLIVSSIFKDLLLTRFAIRIGLLNSDPLQHPYRSKQLAEMFRKANFRNVRRRCIVLLTGDLSFLPLPILRILDMTEDRLQGGRWSIIVGEK
jgi:ubiquinone/menaquinone biosynthesis C-methylase UbiE